MLAARPGLAAELFQAFAASKESYLAGLKSTTERTKADAAALDLASVVGDPFPFGVAANRKALEAMIGFAVEQHMMPAQVRPEELFAPETVRLG